MYRGEDGKWHRTEDELRTKYRGDRNHFYGKKHSAEVQAKIIAANTGAVRSAAVKDAIKDRAIQQMADPAMRRTLSEAMMGKNTGPRSAETRRKMSEGRTGVPLIDGLLTAPEWHRQVKGRADWTCERCGTRPTEDRNVHAHHIDEDRTNNRAANGECLCAACHAEHHKCWTQSRAGTP
jgi:hypothetical protein